MLRASFFLNRLIIFVIGVIFLSGALFESKGYAQEVLLDVRESYRQLDRRAEERWIREKKKLSRLSERLLWSMVARAAELKTHSEQSRD